MAQLSLAFDILARDKASRTLSDVGDSADRAGGKVKGFASNLGTVAKGLIGIAAVKGAFDIGKGLYDAAIESQKVTKQTEAVIKSMGGVAGVSAKQVAKLSEALSMKTGIDDELIQSGQNVLLTFGNIRNEAGKGPKTFDRATKAALDMSVALGTDLDAAAIQVGKALNDPIDGLTKLERSGIQFTDQQKEQIRTMQEAGDMAGAQAVMLAELERQFGGSAEAQATAGDRLRTVWGNLQETLGEKLVPVVEAVSTWLVDALPAAMATAEQVFTDAKPYISDFAAVVGDLVSTTLEALKTWWADNGETVKGYVEAMASAASTAIGALITAGEFVIEHWDKFKYAAAVLAVLVTGHYVGLAAAATISAATQAAAIIGLAATTETQAARISRAWSATLGPLAAVIAAAEMVNDLTGQKGNPNNLSLWERLDPRKAFDGMTFKWPSLGFDTGGIVPGPLGAPQLATVHGGETVLPTHKSGFSMGPDLSSLEWANESQLVELREQNRLLRALVDQRSTRAPRGVAV